MASVTSVLIVDDEPAVRDLMARWVTGLGLEPSTAASAEEAIEALRVRHHDLAVIDIMMPGRNGLWLAAELRRDHPNTAVVMATAHSELAERAAAEASIADFLLKPFQKDRFLLALNRGSEWRREALAELAWHARLSQELGQRVVEICARVAEDRAAGIDETSALLAIASERTPDVLEHAERVARHSAALARELGFDEAQIPDIERAARFHDIGKMALPEALLTKPSCLTPGEMATMRRHVEAGAEILESTVSLRHLAPSVWASHEWYGGGGYPRKIAGLAIPATSRLLAVADAYDSMTEARTEREHLDSADAVSELLRGSPTQFDPEVVIAFLTVLGRD